MPPIEAHCHLPSFAGILAVALRLGPPRPRPDPFDRRGDHSRNAGGDASGADLARARQSQYHADRHLRVIIGRRTQRNRSSIRRASKGGSTRPRAGHRENARATARHPGRAQGQHPHDRHADHRRRARVGRLRAAYEATLDQEPARGRRVIIAKTGRTELAMGGRRPNPMRAIQTAAAIRRQTRTIHARSEGGDVRRTAGAADRRVQFRIGTAANLWAAQTSATDTGGSVISPSNANMLVGIRADDRPHHVTGVLPTPRIHAHSRAMTRT